MDQTIEQVNAQRESVKDKVKKLAVDRKFKNRQLLRTVTSCLTLISLHTVGMKFVSPAALRVATKVVNEFERGYIRHMEHEASPATAKFFSLEHFRAPIGDFGCLKNALFRLEHMPFVAQVDDISKAAAKKQSEAGVYRDAYKDRDSNLVGYAREIFVSGEYDDIKISWLCLEFIQDQYIGIDSPEETKHRIEMYYLAAPGEDKAAAAAGFSESSPNNSV